MSKYVVKCADGAQRHTEPFPDRAAAEEFAEWGHLCQADHSYVIVGTDADGVEHVIYAGDDPVEAYAVWAAQLDQLDD